MSIGRGSLKPNRKATRLSEAPLSELRLRLSLNIPEARRLSGLSRPRIEELLDNGSWPWFWEGKRRRIITQGIVDWQTAKAHESMGVAS